MKLVAHVPGAEPWPIDPGFHDDDLFAAFLEASDQTAADAGSDLLEEPTDDCRDVLARHMCEDMKRALHKPGDRYRAPDGVLYTLEED